MSVPVLSELSVGDKIGTRSIVVTRDALVRYAGASGDFNPIHYNERFALSVGLPSVIAHGMFTMGSVVDVVTEWVGDPGRIIDYVVRFTRPIPVPDPSEGDGQAVIAAAAAVGAINEDSGTARIDLTVSVDGVKVLGKAQATVRLA